MTTSLVVSGVACRFPGADDKHAYWARICSAENAVSPLPTGRWKAKEWFDSEHDAAYFERVAGGYISELEAFDFEHFGINQREAALMDPQQRWLLLIVWQALEDAGYDPKSLRGKKVGVFVGAMTSDWANLQLNNTNTLLPGHVTGNGHALLANRISYLYDFKGMSMTIDTACSSSAVAFIHAANALKSEDCDIALVAGVNAILTPVLQRFYQKAGLLSPSDRCNAFSDHADGIIRSEGVGAVVLEPETSSRNAYCRYVAGHCNHDGQSNGLTAPNGPSQEALLKACYEKAGITSRDIDFVECHGTGTALGDRIEIGALNRVFRGERNRPCRIDSVKALIGHCESAAAMASIIKVALMLKHRSLPANPFEATPNPLLNKGHVALAAEPERWTRDDIKHFAMSSFGLGGTNAHLVFSSPLASNPTQASALRESQETTDALPCFIPVAAKDQESFERQKTALIRALETGADHHALARGHQQFRHAGAVRDVCIGSTHDERKESAQLLGEPPYVGDASMQEKPVVFMFTGQGCQYAGMLSGLYQQFPRFRHYVEYCDAVHQQLTGDSLLPVMLNLQQGNDLLAKARYAQPVLFAVEWALAQWWIEIGIKPDAVIGHSIGEIAAATVAGVMTMEAAMSLVIARGKAIDDVDKKGSATPQQGGMAVVLASKDKVLQLQQDVLGLSLAVWNSATQFVVAGNLDAIEAARVWGINHEVRIKPLNVTHAFHSPQMTGALPALETVAKSLDYQAPIYDWYSTVKGTKQSQDPVDAQYWLDHVIDTVLFKPAFDALSHDLGQAKEWLGIEMGPAPVLSMLAIKNTEKGGEFFSSSIQEPQDIVTFGDTLRSLYRRGFAINWQAVEDTSDTLDLTPFSFQMHDFSRYPNTESASSFAATSSALSTDRFVASSPVASVSASDSDSVPTMPSIQHTSMPPCSKDQDLVSVVQAVTEVVADVTGHAVDAVVPSKRLSSELGLDSVNLIELVDKLRGRLGESAMPELSTLFDVQTVGDLIDALERAAVNQH